MKIFLLFLPMIAASAAILPDTIGDWKKGEATPAAVADQKVWHEYGLQDSETATYTGAASGPKNYSISARRFTDSTGPFAAFNQARPAGSTPVSVTGLGVET